MIQHKQHILVVEDEELHRDILSEQLHTAGYHVITANDGMEAIRLLSERAQEIRLVMLDWMIPELDGIGFLRKIRQHKRFKHLPVIMQTGRSQKAEVQQAIEAGANYYLIKPYEQDKMLGLVRQALQEASRYY